MYDLKVRRGAGEIEVKKSACFFSRGLEPTSGLSWREGGWGTWAWLLHVLDVPRWPLVNRYPSGTVRKESTCGYAQREVLEPECARQRGWCVLRLHSQAMQPARSREERVGVRSHAEAEAVKSWCPAELAPGERGWGGWDWSVPFRVPVLKS